MWLKETLILGLLVFAQANYIDELYDAETIIQKVNKSNTTWTAGHNFPKGTTIGFVKSLFGTHLNVEIPQYANVSIDLGDIEIPEEFDARQKWPNCDSIRQIRDQGNCGGCWAVSGASVFSDRYCIASGSFNMPLSAADLLSCCTECGHGCHGGDVIKAWEYFIKTGIRTGGEYDSNVGCTPYALPQCEHIITDKGRPCSGRSKPETPQCSKTCTNPDYRRPQSLKTDFVKARSFRVVRDVKEIQKEIMTNGPVHASFVAYHDFPTYKTGVYRKTNGLALAAHAVRIIGWGVENGTPYWLICNSWNEDWGENGLFKMIRGQNECGIEGKVIAGYPDV